MLMDILGCSILRHKGGGGMDRSDLKKILAGLSIAGLLTGAGITASAQKAFGASS